MTVMDVKVADSLGLSSLIDERFKGIAKGVGESKILGKILRAPMYINDKLIEISISVLDNVSVGFIFGLDNLKKQRCKIDLFESQICFHDVDITVDLLKDSELNFRFVKREYPTVVESMLAMGLDDKIKLYESIVKAQGVLD